MRLPAEDIDSVSYNAMLTIVEAVSLLHRTLGHVAVQHIEDASNTGHVENGVMNHDLTG